VRQTDSVNDPAIRTRLWRNGIVDKEDFPLADVSDYLNEPGCIVWADLTDPTPDMLNQLGDELGLDRLAIEDAVEPHERPKASRYSTHTFLTAYHLNLNRETRELSAIQISAFVLKHGFVTVHNEGFDVDGMVKVWDENIDLCAFGVEALAYGMLDFIVDGHFDTVQALDDEIEELEDLLFDGGIHRVQRRTFAIRKSLVHARRVVLPMREVVNTITRRDTELDPALRPYFEDLYDHVLRAAEWTESLRDMISSVFETNLSLADARLNTIMKKLTSWAAIIAIPTAVTGFYGQNVPYPGFNQHWGFVTSSVMMVGLVVGLYVMFKRKDWL